LAEAEEAGASVFAYGWFIMAVINFVIIAFVVFMLVKTVNSMKAKEDKAPAAEPEPAGPTEAELLTEIRDLLASKT
jgi:large conductance mechanosensitive channel